MTPPPESSLALSDVLAAISRLREEAWAQRRMFVIALLAAAAVGLFVALGSQEEYTARARLLPYKSGASAQGLSGLAGLAGIRLPSGMGDATLSPDMYPALSQTLEFRSAVLESPLRFSAYDRPATFVFFFDSLLKVAPVSVVADWTVRLPGKVRTAVGGWSTDGPATGPSPDSLRSIPQYSEEYLEHVRELGQRLRVSVDRRTGVVTMVGVMPDRYASADLVRVASRELLHRVIAVESGKADEQLQFITRQHSQAVERYDRTHRELAAFLDGNRVLSTAMATIERSRLERQNDLAFELVQQLSREMEQARLKVSQDTPVFTYLEAVVVPARRSSPNRLMIVAACLFLGFCCAACVVVYRVFAPGLLAQINQPERTDGAIR